jgi:FAD/FMN-containing dehydrogenase
VIERSNPLYEASRRSLIWNYRKFRRYPDVIVQADSEEDVVTAVQFARAHGLKIKTRSGGHSWSGCYMRDGGLLLDISRLQSISIDTKRQRVVVHPGVMARGLNQRLGEVGLAFPTAHCGMVPISGFLLGGGIGLNVRAWGPISVFNIEAVDLVTAQGEKLHADAEHNSELFWAARGGGPGSFFTVTKFYLKAHPLPQAITVNNYILPGSELGSLCQILDEVGPNLDRAVEAIVLLQSTPPALVDKCKKEGAADCHRVAVFSATAFANTRHEAKAILAPLAKYSLLRKALAKDIEIPSSFEQIYQEGEVALSQQRMRADNILADDAVDVGRILSTHSHRAPSDGCLAGIVWLGSDQYADAAFSVHGKYYVCAYAQWPNPVDDGIQSDWLINMFNDLEPLAKAHYINELDREARPHRTPQCFSPTNWQKLRSLRQKYDSEGVYHGFLGVST